MVCRNSELFMKIIKSKKKLYSLAERERWDENSFAPVEDTKLTIELDDCNRIECANFRVSKDNTIENHACISTQAGCKQGCKFCTSGLRGFIRNLEVNEIIGQLELLAETSQITFDKVLLMGVGEPLDNLKNVIEAIERIYGSSFFNKKRRISIATCGLAGQIDQLSNIKVPIDLWISLHAATDKKREKLMPIAKIHHLKTILVAAKKFSEKNQNSRVWLNYMIFNKFNNFSKDAKDLSKLLKGTEKNFNLFLTIPNCDCLGFHKANEQQIEAFRKKLLNEGVENRILKFITAGNDIEAGCGEFLFIPNESK